MKRSLTSLPMSAHVKFLHTETGLDKTEESRDLIPSASRHRAATHPGIVPKECLFHLRIRTLTHSFTRCQLSTVERQCETNIHCLKRLIATCHQGRREEWLDLKQDIYHLTAKKFQAMPQQWRREYYKIIDTQNSLLSHRLLKEILS